MDAMELISECLSRVLTLHGQNVFERFLFAAQNLHLFLVRIEILMKLAASLSQTVELALEMGCVLRSLCLGFPTISICSRHKNQTKDL